MKLLFICYGTGGAEAINEVVKVIKGIKGTNYSVLSCSDFSRAKLDNSERVSESTALKSIDKSIDLVISDRSNGISFQKEVTRKCKELGVKNLVIMDFYLLGVSDYKKLFDELPDYVTAISDLAYEELKGIGFKEEQIFKIGNPAYIRLNNINYTAKFSKSPRILFTSQGGKGNKSHEELVDFLDNCISEFDKRFIDYMIDIKLHPMEEELRGTWDETILKNGWKCNLLEVPTSIDFLTEYIIQYDLLIGLYSTLQVQGQLLGIPSIFEGGNLKDCMDKYELKEFPLMWGKELNYFKVTEYNIRNLIKIVIQ